MTSAEDPQGAAGWLGREWVLGHDGLWFRRGARVLILDDQDRVLLLRAHDLDQPERSWWFTVGGGIDEGEDARAAALREAVEEVGIVLDPASLVGPVLTRSAVFDFARVLCRQDEVFFLARVETVHGAGTDRSAWTPIEHATVDEVRWWALDELAEVDIEVYPEGLVELVRRLLGGWDGTVPHLAVDR